MKPVVKIKSPEIGHSRKGNTKGTNYRPGKPVRVPAIEESLPNPDKELV